VRDVKQLLTSPLKRIVRTSNRHGKNNNQQVKITHSINNKYNVINTSTGMTST